LIGLRFLGGFLMPALCLDAIRARFPADLFAARLGLVPVSTIRASLIDVLISALSSRSVEARSLASSCSEVARLRVSSERELKVLMSTSIRLARIVLAGKRPKRAAKKPVAKGARKAAEAKARTKKPEAKQKPAKKRKAHKA